MNAVITGDIIDYTKLSKKEKDNVLNTLHKTFEGQQEIRTNFESNFTITRGDNIQIELKDTSKALQTSLILKTAINKISNKHQELKMSKQKNIFRIIVLVATLLIFSSLQAKENSMDQREALGLQITNFVKGSNLQKSGAKTGDIIVMYNGQSVKSIEKLSKLKGSCKKEEVKIVLQRDGEEIEITIPKGKLGAHLSILMPEHEVKEDAVILEGYNKLGWGQGMENTFLGALYRIQEKLGEKVSYTDLVGLSGYGFRVQFFDMWCPSSPDATVGKNIGSHILNILGYNFDIYALNDQFEEEVDYETKSKLEMRKIIKNSINKGYPVLAIDMIEVPEWGIITGYQDDGNELFCRTYYDKTKGYEIAQKFPWVIYVINDYTPRNYDEAFDESLILAKEMYNTEKYGEYFSGTKAVEEWIKGLKDAEYIKNADEKRYSEIILANWWIYYSLMEARAYAEEYLRENMDKFKVNSEGVGEIANLYKTEVNVLGKGFNDLPFPHQPQLPEWSDEQRENEIKILEELLSHEKGIKDILNQEI